MQSDPTTISFKRCSKCKESKPLDGFCKASRHPDQKQTICKTCMFEYHRRSYVFKNRPRIDIPGGLRRCCSCKSIKPIGQYYTTKQPEGFRSAKGGIYRKCIQCYKASAKERTERIKQAPLINVETKHCGGCQKTKHHSQFTTNRSQRDWLSPVCVRCEQKARDLDVGLPEYLAGLHRWRKYKLTEEDFKSLFAKQGKACAICRKPLIHTVIRKSDPKRQKTVVDHCHASGKVRGILCFRCNAGLGVLEQEEWVKSATEYLHRHKA